MAYCGVFNCCMGVITGRNWEIGICVWNITCRACGSGIVFGMGVNMDWNSTFLKKLQFLIVILLDPSILIWYWWEKSMITLPVMFHQWLNLCITILKRTEFISLSIIRLCDQSIALTKYFFMPLCCNNPFRVWLVEKQN